MAQMVHQPCRMFQIDTGQACFSLFYPQTLFLGFNLVEEQAEKQKEHRTCRPDEGRGKEADTVGKFHSRFHGRHSFHPVCAQQATIFSSLDRAYVRANVGLAYRSHPKKDVG